MSSWNLLIRGIGSALCAAIIAAAPISAGTAGAQTASASTRASGLEERVRLLTSELSLDAGQQTEVRKALQEQREQMLKAWGDNSVPAAYRVNATRAISERTADRIRALLSEEQKAKYIAPSKPHEPQSGESKRSVEEWMNAAGPKQSTR